MEQAAIFATFHRSHTGDVQRFRAGGGGMIPGYVAEVQALLERLDPLIPEKRLPYPRWIVTPEGDLGSEWCSNCGYFKVRNLRRRDRKRRADYILDGGWRTEEEHFCFCQGCGVRLDVSLLDYGVREEISHFEEHGFSTAPGEDAYELGELLSAIEYRGDNERADQEEMRSRVIAVVERFLAEAR